ncbi:hypothetical protein [Paenibacillus odorifer]|uniref:hypothetical protein n=1 Tax=Paenibacillus odorifer TaxID=189426 RepID=UPI00096DCE37|nr:hypothetical protein [Paenibacillus odorifer]OMD08392.1 hypothetical protein BJP50_07320 [Paenibacillus odorifer]
MDGENTGEAQGSKYPFNSIPMMKQVVIQMNVIDGTIDFEHDENITYSEVLGMIEYTKMLIMQRWLDEINLR